MYRHFPLLIGLACLCLPSTSTGQDGKYQQSAPADAFEDGSEFAYYGSENEWNRRQFTAERAERQPKRRGQRLLLQVVEGQTSDAMKSCQQRLKVAPDDLETLFAKTVAHCDLGQPDEALATMQRALEAGLPLERFLAGPRKLLEPLTRTREFQELAAKRQMPLVHGPMLGAVTDRSARIWVRTVNESEVVVSVFDRESAQPAGQATVSSTAKNDYAASVEIGQLKPDKKYEYNVVVDDAPVFDDSQRPAFRTYPIAGTKTKFQIGFGGGAGFNPEHERIWDTIAARRLDAFLLLGDNVYIDLPETAGPVHRYTYYRRQSRPEFRRLVRSTPIYAIWDDHDCATDDVWMGPYLDRPVWKSSLLAHFKENWANPSYGDEQWPGCWFRFSIGDVDFFLLDCRYYRTNPFTEPRSMLGPTQKAWLLEALRSSTATFKVLVSSVAWAPGAKPGSHDTWDGFPKEREEIFSTIEEARINGVVLVSADRHRSDAWRIDRPRGYAFFDFMSSRLTNIHTHECFDEALFCYNQKCSFGSLTFDTTLEDPAVTYRIVNIDGDVVHELTLRRAQ